MEQMNLEQVGLRELVLNPSGVDFSTWQTAREVFANMVKPVWPITANLALYHLVEGELVLTILEREGNPFTERRSFLEIWRGLKDNKHYFLPQDFKEEIMITIDKGQSVSVSLSRLELMKYRKNTELCRILPGRHNCTESKALFDKVFGAEETRPMHGLWIKALDPDIIRPHLERDPDGMIARACCIDVRPYFNAAVRINNDIRYILAVRRPLGETANDAQKSAVLTTDQILYNMAVTRVLKHPELLDDGHAHALNGMVTEYFDKRNPNLRAIEPRLSL